MGATHFSGPVYSGGVMLDSVLGGLGQSVPIGLRLNGSGGSWFVDPENGADGNPGQTADAAFSTVAKALTLALPGDTIFLQPGSYEENIVVTTDYITLAGAQVGRYGWPDIVPASGIPLTVTAQGFVASRIRFAGTAADSVLQHGNGFLYTGCVFDGDGTAAKAGLRLVGSSTDDSLTASEGFVLSNTFRGCAIGICFDSAAAPVGVGSTDNEIAGNRFYSNTLDIATADSGGAGTTYSVKLVNIHNNSFEDKNKATYLDFTTANGGAASDQSGAVNDNVFASDTMTTTKIKAVGTGFTFAGNRDTVGIFDGSGLD